MNTTCIDAIIEKANSLDWHCRVCDDELEFENWSPAGEDIVFYVGLEDPVRAVREYAYGFDADEHAEMWVNNMHNVRGVPQSIRALINDADAIQEMLDELADALGEVEE